MKALSLEITLFVGAAAILAAAAVTAIYDNGKAAPTNTVPLSASKIGITEMNDTNSASPELYHPIIVFADEEQKTNDEYIYENGYIGAEPNTERNIVKVIPLD